MHYLKKYDQLSGDGSTVWPVAYRNKMPLMMLSRCIISWRRVVAILPGDVLGALNEGSVVIGESGIWGTGDFGEF